MRRIISLLVRNQSGVLNRITGVLTRRQFNIESISVGEVEDNLSRITIVVNIDKISESEQIIKQLYKQVDVLKVSDITNEPHLVRELVLLKIHAPISSRMEIAAVIAPFRADIVDVSQKSLIIQVVGASVKVNACIEALRPYVIKEIARTGVTSLKRG